MFFINKKFLKISAIAIISFVFQSCIFVINGNNEEEEEWLYETVDISGIVFCNETNKPIPGIHITIQGSEKAQRSNKDGSYRFYLSRQDVINIQFEDVDGPFNEGLFITKTESINFKKINSYTLNVYLNKAE